jgi:hypothetical protein
LISVAVLSGCKQPIANPELADPIYQDLQTRATAHAKDFDEVKAKIPSLAEALQKAEPNTIDKKDAEKELAKAKVKLLDSEQWARYYRIRVERRRVEDHIAYQKAFAADQPWPPPGEFADYQLNRRLVESPRNWNLRVPKMASRLPSGEGKPKAKAEAEAKEE